MAPTAYGAARDVNAQFGNRFPKRIQQGQQAAQKTINTGLQKAQPQSKWKKRLLGGAALIGGAVAAKKGFLGMGAQRTAEYMTGLAKNPLKTMRANARDMSMATSARKMQQAQHGQLSAALGGVKQTNAAMKGVQTGQKGGIVNFLRQKGILSEGRRATARFSADQTRNIGQMVQGAGIGQVGKGGKMTILGRDQFIKNMAQQTGKNIKDPAVRKAFEAQYAQRVADVNKYVQQNMKATGALTRGDKAMNVIRGAGPGELAVLGTLGVALPAKSAIQTSVDPNTGKKRGIVERTARGVGAAGLGLATGGLYSMGGGMGFLPTMPAQSIIDRAGKGIGKGFGKVTGSGRGAAVAPQQQGMIPTQPQQQGMIPTQPQQAIKTAHIRMRLRR